MSISIVTVNWNAYDFAKLLITSTRKFSKENHEIIVVDNSEHKKKLVDCNLYPQDKNIGHGEGLNIGLSKATGDYVLVLDIDCMIMCDNWENLFLKHIKKCDIIAAKGSPAKPIRPACMFMDRKFAIQFDYRSSEGYRGHRITPEGFDVGIRAYLEMLRLGKSAKLLDPVIREKRQYKTLNGEEYEIDGKSVVYHHWHGSHIKNRQYDYKEDLEEDKRKFFKMINWNIAKML